VLEYSIIQTRGFTNVIEDGRVTGFQLLVRMPNYRGAWASLVDGADVSVDGRAFSRDSTRWTLRGRTFTLNELRRSTGVHWDLAELATITVPLDGGLAPGVHDVAVAIYLRSPYIPAFVLPLRFDARRECTLVPAGTDDGFRYGVSLYSFTGDMNTLMTLEDAMADIADLGAAGIEILTQSTLPGYPEPSAAWIDEWKRAGWSIKQGRLSTIRTYVRLRRPRSLLIRPDATSADEAILRYAETGTRRYLPANLISAVQEHRLLRSRR
jgi:hypothetical protein